MKGSASRLLINTIRTAYDRLGFAVIDDEAFFQLLLARLVEPTSKSDSIRVLDELGADAKHRSTFTRCLQRINADAYQGIIAGKCFDVGSRQTKAPNDLATFFTWNGANTDDGQLVDTLTPRATVALNKSRTLARAEPVWSPVEHPKAWPAVWQYRRKRAARDRETLNLQRNRAMRIPDGESKPKAARFVKTKGAQKVFDENSYDKAVGLAGWKGYVTDLEAKTMTACDVVGSYHDLWHGEQSFRMSKTDLRACPIFHRTRDAIEAHLTVCVHGFGPRAVYAGGDGAVAEENHHHVATVTRVRGRDRGTRARVSS